MVHWSRFAGSLWDSLLTAHIPVEASTERAMTFDAAVVDFLDNTFPDFTTRLSPQHRHQYVRMSFDSLRLMAQHATTIPLLLDRTTVQIYSQIIVDALSHVQLYEGNIEQPYSHSLRYYSIPTLGSSLLLLCNLLTSDLDQLGLPLHSWIPTMHQSFDTILEIIDNKARENVLARRILRDFEKITPVVQAALSRWSTEAMLSQTPPDWSIVEDTIPPNVAQLLPYKQQLPDIRCPSHQNTMWASNGGYQDTSQFSSWDEGLQPGGRGRSVLWI